MPRKLRKTKQIEPAITPELIETEREMAALEPMDEIRHIPDEPVDAKDDEVLQAKAQLVEKQSEAPQHSPRRWTGRALIGHHTPSRGTVRVIDDGAMVGVQLDEPPSPEELRILREPAENGQRGLTWNSVRGTNLKPTNGNPIAARLDCEQRAEAVARGRGWRSALDEQRSEPEGHSR